MAFTLTVLGSGTSVPMATRMSPAYLVRAGELTILLDCGSGCTTSLVRAGARLETLSGILLTHLHPDHTADLLPLLFALSNPMGPQRSAPLWLWGPAGIGDYLRTLHRVYGNWVRPRGVELRQRELEEGDVLELGPLVVVPHAVTHAGASLAYRLIDAASGQALCFSGDSGVCAGLEAAARGATILLCECAALEDETAQMHLKATEVGRLAATAGCGSVVLTHLYPQVEASDPVPRVQQHYEGPVRLAEDGLVIEVR